MIIGKRYIRYRHKIYTNLRTSQNKKMKELAIVFLIGLLNSLNVFSQSTGYKINELISAYAENGQFNGAILIKKGENIVYKNAFGFANREWDIPNTLDSKFLIGSIGNSITNVLTHRNYYQKTYTKKCLHAI